MKNLKLLIVLLSILSLGLIIVLIILGLQNNSNNNKNKIIETQNNIVSDMGNNVQNEIGAEAPQVTFNTSLNEITADSMLYSISKNINKYFEYIKNGNSQAVNELGGNNIYIIANDSKYCVKYAYSTSNENMTKYYTYGILNIANGNYTATQQEIYMVVYLTAENQGYKVQTITKEEFANMTELTQEEKIDILQGIYNIYEYEYIDTTRQMEIYLEDYSFQIFNNTENAYKLLNQEYRDTRFGNLNKFVEFLNEKLNQLVNIEITQIHVEKSDDGYTIYQGTDKYGNYYEIVASSYMEYTIILDSYTMDDYSNENDETKIKKSVEKFILMLNSADYSNAYNLLESTFRLTYFPTEQDFINYIKTNWFERNIIASKEINEEGICTVIIKQTLSTTSNKMQKQFKVNIGEGMEFTIEFNM